MSFMNIFFLCCQDLPGLVSDLGPGLSDCGHVAARHVEYPGVQLTSLGVDQEQGGAVGIDQLLCLVHYLQDQSVHAHHLLEYRPETTRLERPRVVVLLSIPDYREQEIIDVFLMMNPGVLVGVVDTNPSPHQVAVDNLDKKTEI